jgi:hypothetical protein
VNAAIIFLRAEASLDVEGEAESGGSCMFLPECAARSGRETHFLSGLNSEYRVVVPIVTD